MQVLKEEMRKRIYEAALKEFSEKGFMHASMRDIAKGAGMTVGNLYRYFKDKETLFYNVTGPAYSRLTELVKECLKLVEYRFDTSFFEFLSEQILKICKAHKIELLILFEGSRGTVYEKSKEEMASVVENFLMGMPLTKLKAKGVTIEDTYIFRLISLEFVDGMIRIAKRFEDVEKLKRVASQYINFYFKDILKRFE
ncbi:MAG: TetR/AcrR family transcriptional regulator [Caulobacteraceae bacterium]